jgi:hypothetical protein
MRLASLGMLAAVASALSLVAPAAAKPQRPVGLNKLWSQYPLNPAVAPPNAPVLHVSTTPAGASHTGAARQRPPAPVAEPKTKGTSGTNWGWVWIAIAAVAVVGMTAVAVAIRIRQGGGRGMTEFLRPRGWRNQKDRGRQHEDRPDEPERQQPPAAALSDLENIGDHIASVLGAAEEAARTLRAEAQKEASSARGEAERMAEELRARTSEEVESMRAAAQKQVEEAEDESSRIRTEADRYAEERRRQAELQATQIVRDAERRAATLADVAAERHRVLLANIDSSESRLRDLAKSLSTVATALEGLVGDGRRKDAPERPAEEADAEIDLDRSVISTLREYVDTYERASAPTE